MEKKGIIFDMDGTLWDSSEGVAESWTCVINKEYDPNCTITQKDVQNVMGKTMDQIADILLPGLEEKKRQELLKHCCQYENEYLREHGGVLYPELESTLQALAEKYHLYIVSNCQKGYIEAFLDYYGFSHYFEDIECFGNNLLPKGENIRLLALRNDLTKAVYVGDIQGDYDAATYAGVPFIHAAYGFGVIADKTAKIECFADLPKAAEEILG